MSEQSLFPDFDAAGEGHRLSRRTDPDTSHLAAEAIVEHLPRMQKFAAECVRLNPGSTARELDAKYPGTDGMIRKRLKEAERRGLVRRGPSRVCSVSGRMAETWWPIDNGEQP